MSPTQATFPSAYLPPGPRAQFSHRTPRNRPHRRQRIAKADAQEPGSMEGTGTSETELDETTVGLLDQFWKARGVFDPEQRRRLVHVASRMSEGKIEKMEEDRDEGGGLPGVATIWQLDERPSQVVSVSHRLKQLHDLLGGQPDIDVVFMCVREPGLLKAGIGKLTRRLLDMKLSSAGGSSDVAKIVERQPSLLLQEDAKIDSKEPPEEQLEAWEYGLASDADSEWQRRFMQLDIYHNSVGDSHVGFRDGDDPDLARWADKQRNAWKKGVLDDKKKQLLASLGFEFVEEDAEWMRWFTELRKYQESTGAVSPMAISSGTNFLLNNWCSVQRVARRAGVLPKPRESLLSAIGFDWTAADALS